MSRNNAVTKYLAEIGRKGGKASGKARMEKLTPEKRAAVARNAAAARWSKPVSQTDLQLQSALQAEEWAADRAAQMGAEKINLRLADGATVAPGKLTFDEKLKMAVLKTATRTKASAAPGNKSKSPS